MTVAEERTIAEFRTTDLGLAAYLDLVGFDYQRLEKRGPKKVVWVFDRNEALEAEVDAFQNRDAEVEPIAFQGRLTDVRRHMFEFLDAA